MASLLMLNGPKRIFLTVVGISVWTLLQSFFHLFWIVYSYNSTICKVKPSHYDIVFIYLTYFYNKSCGRVDIKNEGLFFNVSDQNDHGNDRSANETVSEVLYEFLKATLENASLPETSPHADRANTYLMLFIVTDVIWITTALLLLGGAFVKLKKFWFLISYGPYLIITAYVVFLDVVSSVHFGLDMLEIHSYSTWLKFIGAANYKDFEYFNTYDSPKLVPVVPAMVMATLFSRFFFAWLANVLCFFIIFFLLSAVYPERGRNKSVTSAKDLSTSEARIRNWQQFYGAIEANSTMASANSASGPYYGQHFYTDHNSNENASARDVARPTKNSGHGENFPVRFQNYPDFYGNADGQMATFSETIHHNNIEPILKGHVPWSYTKPYDNYAASKNPIYVKTVIFHENIQSTQL